MLGGRGRRRVLLLALGLALVAPAAATATLLRPARPFALDAVAPTEIRWPHVAASPAGDVLVGATRQEQEDPARFHFTLQLLRHDGRLVAVRGLGARRELLSVAPQPARSGAFTVLMGGSEAGRHCCTFVEAADVSSRGVAGRPRRLVSTGGGEVVGRLISLPGHLLAVIGAGNGLWIAQAGSHGFGGPRRLTPAGVPPESVAAGAGPGGSSEVVWTLAEPHRSGRGAGAIFLARGGAARAPAGGHVLQRLGAGHTAEELALPAAASAPALAWVDSAYEADGSLDSTLQVLLPGSQQTAAFTVPRRIFSGPAVAADPQGDVFLAVRTCTRFGSCEVRVTLRHPGGGFGPLQRAGAIDATATPTLAGLPGGGAELAWVSQGSVRFATLGRKGAVTTTVRPVAGGGQDSAPVLAALPGGGALTAFARGLRAPALWGALLSR